MVPSSRHRSRHYLSLSPGAVAIQTVTTIQRGAFTIILGAVIAAGCFGAYKYVQSRLQRSATAPAPAVNPGEVFSVPPFATREPDQYQATRIITTVSTDADAVQREQATTRILIARAGDKRREDYDNDTDFRTSYIELPTGTFVLLHSKKVYAEIKPASGKSPVINQDGAERSDSGADFSPNTLLNEANGARYEKLGSEKLDNRPVTKYRVMATAATNETAAPIATLIWIDEALGMPIKSETKNSDGNHHEMVTTELRDIQLQVDLKLFELPADFRRVEESQLREWLRQIQSAAAR